MIHGFASPAATDAHGKRHPSLQYDRLGRTDLRVSQAGFGGYRIRIGSDEHRKALTQALLEGVNLVDTSANYADGGSEELVGDVLETLIDADHLTRQAVVLVSKGGYIQGQNYALSQARKQQGRPFADLVPYADGLEHCIHPEFLEDQLSRSLKRLKAETLDVYLLHNPEYYLSWAVQNGSTVTQARGEYYRRIRLAFAHLEKEVTRGRIRGYGISSNSFPARSEDPQFTCLQTVWETAESISDTHHFRVIQFPMNLLETGALLESNQPGGGSVLRFAREKRLGVLINRPLNAMGGKRLIRLAEASLRSAMREPEIERRIAELIRSEEKLETDVLPALELAPDLRQRVAAQTAAGGSLLQQWRNFGDLERWRQIVSAYFLPRNGGVIDFLRQQAPGNPSVDAWIRTHQAALQEALHAVSTVYEAAAAVQAEKIKRAAAASDPDWQEDIPLSRTAIRALRSTAGIHSVLVGMRRKNYVADVLEELKQPIDRKERFSSWQALQTQMAPLVFESGAA